MYKVKRTKRDTVENIYQHCKLSGNCPTDVVNKVEQTTLADILLKIFGSVIYLGGLGIGTGSGVGTAGLRPLPENVPIPESIPTEDILLQELPSRPTTRPNRPTTFGTRIDPISSAGNRPRPVNPRGPAIVPLSEGGLPDATVIGGTSNTLGEYEVLTNVDIFEESTTVNGHPTVLHGQEEVAILEVTPEQAISRSVYITHPESDDIVTFTESNFPNSTDINIFVSPDYSGVQIGEDIELSPVNTIQEFEIQENVPRTSTPSRLFEATVGRARQFYNRLVEQAPTRNIDFLGQPSRAILFEYDNPAFSADVTLTFERDLQEIAAAPDITFTDVTKLQRPYYSETSEGLVRFSRMGTRGKISTRSGNILKQNVHFYYDISPITSQHEVIELNTLNTSNITATVVDELSTSTVINPLFEDNLGESDLLDEFPDVFDNGHLALIGEEEEEQTIIPMLTSDTVPKVYSSNYLSTFSVINSENNPIEPTLPTNIDPSIPGIQINPVGSDYYLHPSLLKRRKRKHSELF